MGGEHLLPSLAVGFLVWEAVSAKPAGGVAPCPGEAWGGLSSLVARTPLHTQQTCEVSRTVVSADVWPSQTEGDRQQGPTALCGLGGQSLEPQGTVTRP